MIVCDTIAEIRAVTTTFRNSGHRIGFVPTMGYLHDGHLSLIRQSQKETNHTIVSIFINPSQFNDPDDYTHYPRDTDRDLKMLRELDIDVVYIPSVSEMYPTHPDRAMIWLDIERLGDHLCGRSRPGHFRGVLTVVAKLFNQIQPDIAYFGAKDFQQARIIEQMVTELAFPIRIRRCPICREADGLAMSSRNARLSPEDRRNAPRIYAALVDARQFAVSGPYDADQIRNRLTGRLRSIPGAKIDYCEIVDQENLAPITGIPKRGHSLIAVAVFFGPVRLIDNIEI